MSYPYGQSKFDVTKNAKGEFDRIFINHDIPFKPSAQNQGRIGPFLTALIQPTGYVGAGQGLEAVTGSPCGYNKFRVDGPLGSNIGGEGINSMETDLFMVMGKVATRAGVEVTRSTYTRGDWDPGIEVFARTMATDPAIAPDTLQVTGQDPLFPSAVMIPGALDPSGIWRNYYGFIAGDFPPGTPITVRNTADPDETGVPFPESAQVRDLDDTVTIHEAYYHRTLNELEIVASTSDEVTVCPDPAMPLLTAYGDDGTVLGNLTPGAEGLMLIINPGVEAGVFVPPAHVTVKSCFGGSVTEALGIGFCERAGNSQSCTGGVGNNKNK